MQGGIRGIQGRSGVDGHVDTVQVQEVSALMSENAVVGLRIEDAGIARGHQANEGDRLHHGQMIGACSHHPTPGPVGNGARYVTDVTSTTQDGATCPTDTATRVQTG